MLDISSLELMLYAARETPDKPKFYRASGDYVGSVGFAVQTLKRVLVTADDEMLCCLSQVATFFQNADSEDNIVCVGRTSGSYVFHEFEFHAAMIPAAYRALALGHGSLYSFQAEQWIRTGTEVKGN
jgi:hypothetical protein